MQTLKTLIPVNENCDFSIYNIPFGVYSDKDVKHHVWSAIGDYIIDLFELESKDVFDINRSVFDEQYLNSFIELGKPITIKFALKLLNCCVMKILS